MIRAWRQIDKMKIALAALSLAGFALRVYGLGHRALWDDEAFSVAIAGLDPARMAAALVHDTFPPLHSIVLWATMHLLGPSEFAIRFASLMPGVLTVPVAYQLGRRLAGRRVGLCAAGVTVCSGFGVYFAQEARAYSWMLLLSMCSAYTFLGVMRALEAEGRAGTGRWIAFVLVSAAMLHTHFLSAWVLLVEAAYFWGWWAIRWRRMGGHTGPPLRVGGDDRRGGPVWPPIPRRSPVRSWIASQFAIGALFAPWMAFVIVQNMGQAARPAEVAGARTGFLGPLLWIWQEGRSTHGAISLPATLRQALISFSVGDFVPSLWALPLALAFLALMVVGWIGLWRGRRRGAAIFLALYALGPVLLSYGAAFPTSRPHWAKYFMMALPAFNLAVAAGIATIAGMRTAAGRPIGAQSGSERPCGLAMTRTLLVLAAASLVAAASGWGLWNYQVNPAYARSDPRPAVRYLEALSTGNDALLCNPPAASPPFWHYYHGDLPWIDPTQQKVGAAVLQDVSERRVGLWVVQNLPLGFDPDESIERWLTTRTYRTLTEWVGPLVFRYYSMPAAGGPAVTRDLGTGVRFGDDIALQRYGLGVQAGGRAQIAQLDLTWKALSRPAEEYMVGVQVVDAQGRVWGRTNSAPLGNFRPTVTWDTGEVIPDHLGLMLYPGTPPGDYRVQVWLYRDSDRRVLPLRGVAADQSAAGERLDLGAIRVPAPREPPTTELLALDATVDRDLGGVRLIGAQAAGGPVQPGDRYEPVLFWQAAEDGDAQAAEAALWLAGTSGDRIAVQSTRVGGWPVGQVRRDPQTLALPADLLDGRYALTVQVGDSGPVVLRTVTVKGREKHFDVPRIGHPRAAKFGGQIELLGYDLTTDRVKPGGMVVLTLYWRTLSNVGTSYTVFNHLVGANGVLAGQWDSVPVGGTLPTTEWSSGEIIADRYQVPVGVDARLGEARLQIGWYDAATGARLPVEGGGDSVELKTPIQIAN